MAKWFGYGKVAEESEFVEPTALKPRAIFGINGKVKFSLRLTQTGDKMIFPIGNKIAIADTKSNEQEFLTGHTHDVSCLDVGRTGRYVASGQINHMGFRAYVILWDFEKREEIARHDLHKVKVQSLCFSAEDKYVLSIGGEDDGCVIVFDIKARSPICRSVAARHISGVPICIAGLNNNANYFVVAGDRHLRMWSLQRERKKLNVTEIASGKYQRKFTCMVIDAHDKYAYMGTMSGDIIKVALNCCDPVNVTQAGLTSSLVGAYGVYLPNKPAGKDCARFVNGVRHLAIAGPNLLLIGAGDGCVELLEDRGVKDSYFKEYPNPTWPMFISKGKCRVNGVISGLEAINPLEYYLYTEENEIYKVNIKTFSLKLLKTGHQRCVNRIIFPKNMSNIFATAGYESVRIWSVVRLQELLRIIVHNFTCADIIFTHDGTSIISVWNDGIVRAFTPIYGRLIYAIPTAHNKGCSAVAVSSNGRVLITGGIEGQVRVWKIEAKRQDLVGILKDHSGPITSLDMNKDDTEVISASSDGSCVIWDVIRLTRKKVIIANTQFMCGRYFPSGVQVLTCGSDGMVCYWMVYNGSLIRELEASHKSPVNCVSISQSGRYFVTGGNDQIAKFWDYDRGVVLAQGTDHASSIKSCKIDPKGKFFVTGSADGSIIIWDIPEQYWDTAEIVDQPKMDSKDNLSSKGSKSKFRSSQPENIKSLEAKAKKDEVLSVECPEVPKKVMPKDVPSMANVAKKC